MFVGHLAVALGAKRVSPRTPLSALVAAAFGLDLLWPLLLLAGIEHVRVEPGHTAFTPLAFDHYPWSHSMSMAVVWAVAVGRLSVVVLKRAAAGLAIGLAVVSHWLLDYVTHIADLPLWPGGPEVGLGLWNSIPGTLVVEGLFFSVAVAAYVRATRPRQTAGTWSLGALIILATMIWVSGPWSPPPPSERAIAWVGLAMWLFPFWGTWIDRTRQSIY
jgi:membrane-bound metal-dependent hydrolase YbcI (DUF457 family)